MMRSLIVILFLLTFTFITALSSAQAASVVKVSYERLNLVEDDSGRTITFNTTIQNISTSTIYSVELSLELFAGIPQYYTSELGPNETAEFSETFEISYTHDEEPPELAWNIEFKDENGNIHTELFK